MKSRLDKSPLSQMMCAFAGEKALAQKDLRALQSAALDEVALIRRPGFPARNRDG